MVAVADREVMPGARAPARVQSESRVGALDGLRAFAVIAVVAYHVHPRRLPSGYLGVDVFMVVSGFLITGLLVGEHRRTGRIRFAAFLGRRFRRLVPALALVVATVAVWVAALGDDGLARSVRDHGRSALIYVTNWKVIADGTTYGGAAAAESPLVHLWSLAIEEQFYLCWPPVLMVLLALGRGRRGLAIAVATVGAVGSAILMAALDDPRRIYYGTDTRAQAFLVGALAALAAPYLGERVRRAVATGGIVALAALVAIMRTDAPDVLSHGGFAVVAMLAAIVVLATTMPGVVSSVLGRTVFRGIGRVSYGVYLWHWPAIVLCTPARIGVDGVALTAVQLAVTAAGAGVSWMLLERPSRHWRPRRVGVVGAGLLGVAALALVQTPRPAPVMYADYRIDGVRPPVVLAPPITTLAPSVPVTPATTPALALPPTGTAMIVGDSGMASGAPALAAGLQAAGWRVVDTSYPGIGVTQPVDVREGWARSVRDHDVDLTIVMLGGWDSGWVRANGDGAYRALLDDAVASFAHEGGKVVWLSVLPGGDVDDRDLEHLFAELPLRHQGIVEYFDIESALRAPDGTWPPVVDGRRLRGPDGWHLCPDGAAAVARVALAHLGLDRPGWDDGPWRAEPRYQDPPGVCAAP